METTIKKYWNCTELKIKIKGINISFIKINEDLDKSLKNFAFFYNRYENGNVEIFVSLFKKYQIEINGIKLTPGKRKFYGIN